MPGYDQLDFLLGRDRDEMAVMTAPQVHRSGCLFAKAATEPCLIARYSCVLSRVIHSIAGPDASFGFGVSDMRALAALPANGMPPPNKTISSTTDRF